MEEQTRNKFSGKAGFILASASSAVGLGNIWRFPYLAARDGGGLFLFIYLIFSVTFGFALLVTEIAIGRKTRKSALTAYGSLNKKWKWIGIITIAVPSIVLPYYCVIGGWVLKYFGTFLEGSGFKTVQAGYFTRFISHDYSAFITFFIFLSITSIIVLFGIEKGIEKFSKIVMPILLVLIIVISLFSLFLSYTTEDGTVRTGLQGLKILFIPNFENITIPILLNTITDAMGQLFYSLSLASGIMIAFGSYAKDEENIENCVSYIELFDTGVAFIAALMIIPSVYVFMGAEGLQYSGPGLMFISLPKVFFKMGFLGNIFGTLFFALVFFAAITSSVALEESIVSSLVDRFNISRNKSVLITTSFLFIIGTFVCLGYNRLYFEFTLPNGTKGQLLDILDYIANNIFAPVAEIGLCILIGWILKPKTIVDEITKNGEKFRRLTGYSAMLKYIAPFILAIILITSLK